MDQNTFQTYELPVENVPDQYFVVQDDGTLLINRQIQFVTEIKDSKEEVQSDTVDLSSQQLFVDVGSSADLITLSDQLISSTDNNLYNGTFLLQPGTSSATEPIGDQKEGAQDLKINIDTSNKQANDFTEITLNAEQYRILEQKGWILCESNDKIFVLNTLGLHDITENDKLIKKLRNSIQNDNESEANVSCPTVGSQPSPMTTILQNFTTDANIDFIYDENPVQQNVEGSLDSITQKEGQNVDSEIDNVDDPNNEISAMEDTTNVNANVEVESLKIKTKYSFKDIPDKIFLGKTQAGKSLYAKVKNSSKPIVIYEINEDNAVNKFLIDNPDMDRSQFLSLVYNIKRRAKDTKQFEDDMAAAKPAIAEILKIPEFKDYIVEQYLFITRIIHKIDDTNNMVYKSKPSLLTAALVANDQKQLEFMYSPNILDNFVKDLSVECSELSSRKTWKMQVSHIHIKEVKSTNNIKRVYVTLAKQQLSFINADEKPRRRPLLHACSSCAAVFTSEQELEAHQQNECMNPDDPDDPSSVDPEGSNNQSEPPTIVQDDSEDLYLCVKCNAKFFELSECEKHRCAQSSNNDQIMESDFSIQNYKSNADTDSKSNPDSEPGANKKVYKCTMCPATFLHSSTFSKHIMSQHIKLQINT